MKQLFSKGSFTKRLFTKGLLAFVSIALLTQCTDNTTEATPNADSSSTTSVATELPKEDWKIGVQFWTFKEFPFVTAVEKADSAGIKFIEAFPGQALGGNFKGSFNVDMSAERKKGIQELLSSKGMRIVAFGVTGAKDAAEWNKLFAFAKEMGFEYINSEPNKSHWGIIDSLSGVYGVKVAIHEHPKPNPYWHPDSVVAAMTGHPNLYACADLGHWGRSGLDVVECLKKLEGRIIGVHLKDIKDFNNTKAEDVVVGTGALKYPEILTELKRQNFKGMMSVEREGNWQNNMPDVKQTVDYVNGQIKSLK
ncbi:MAG: sugar phosphate isomerase/epimerase [Chitinophagaceae bacterium]|nr:MAG: sugar phosphate isomerase/epimerase [Chitinophagaceae bacterium]